MGIVANARQQGQDYNLESVSKVGHNDEGRVWLTTAASPQKAIRIERSIDLGQGLPRGRGFLVAYNEGRLIAVTCCAEERCHGRPCDSDIVWLGRVLRSIDPLWLSIENERNLSYNPEQSRTIAKLIL